MAGETTARTGFSAKNIPAAPGPVITGAVWSHELTTGQLELADVLQMGYIPNGCTLLGFHYYVDDIDSSTTLVWKITVGSTDVVTGLTYGRTAGGGFIGVEPLTVTTASLVVINFTTAPTAAAGTIYLVPMYIAN